jgi:hypothetical protein
MANSNGWGDGSANNAIGWGQGANNAIGWGDIHADSWAGLTDIVGVTTDPDAQAFITEAAITDPTQQAAINTLVVDLKGYSIWSKMKALYPFVGGTATSHKFNLKDPRDLDAAYRLFFSGGWLHTSNGAISNGVNSNAQSYFSSSSLNTNSAGASAYCANTNGDGSHVAFFNSSGSNNPFYLFSGVNRVYGAAFSYGNAIDIATSGNGFIQISALSGTTKLRKNNTILGSVSTSGSLFTQNNILIGRNTTVNSEYSNTTYRFFSFHDGLTDTEAANFYTAVQAFQTTLGRQV